MLNLYNTNIPTDSVTLEGTEGSMAKGCIETLTAQKEMETSMAKGCVGTIIDDEGTSESEMRLGYFGLGLHERLEVPEADKLLEVVGQIEGRPAKILLDTGCSTYVLSSSFTEQNGIPGIRMRPRPVDLAVSSARANLTNKTEPLDLSIGNTVIRKSLYLLPVPQFDAIVGIPFFRENEINLTGLESGSIEVNGSKVPMSKGDMDMEESPGNMEIPTIGMISRRRIKKELRC